MADRVTDMQKFEMMLKSDIGQQFVEELETCWDQFNLLGEDPHKTAYNVGLRDAFKFIKDIQNGAFTHE
jgi:hypothetical protein